MTIDDVNSPEGIARLYHNVRSAGLLILFLDFDGTLAAITDRPERVRLDPPVQETLARLVGRRGVRVAVVSGRTVEDLKSRLPMEGLYLAGNHGLEVDGPTIQFLHPGAAERVDQVELLAGELLAGLAPIPGVLIENKRLSVACHNRAVPSAQRPAFWAEVRRVLARNAGNWRVVPGRSVVEFLAAPDWTKGSCARLLREHFESQMEGNPGSFSVAIGDDRTDRDLLAEVLSRGCAIAVGDSLGRGWDLQVQGVPAVHTLLARLDRLRSEDENLKATG